MKEETRQALERILGDAVLVQVVRI